ncbi:MAG: type II secretion system protein [Patescibacteria group bacterium]
MKDKYGFSLVELIVVIGIIGLLVTFTVIWGVRARLEAAALKTIKDFEAFETALVSYGIENLESWPTHAAADYGDYTIQRMVNQTGAAATDFPGFNDFLTQDITPIRNNSNFAYTYYYPVGNPAVSCGASDSYSSGVSVRLGCLDCVLGPFVDLTDIHPRIDEIVDGAIDADCGKIRYGGTDNSLYYLIADNANNFFGTRGLQN